MRAACVSLAADAMRLSPSAGSGARPPARVDRPRVSANGNASDVSSDASASSEGKRRGFISCAASAAADQSRSNPSPSSVASSLSSHRSSPDAPSRSRVTRRPRSPTVRATPCLSLPVESLYDLLVSVTACRPSCTPRDWAVYSKCCAGVVFASPPASDPPLR